MTSPFDLRRDPLNLLIILIICQPLSRCKPRAMTSANWMTSGAQRLKAHLGRSFGARKIRKNGRNRNQSGRTSLPSTVVGPITHRPNNESKCAINYMLLNSNVICVLFSWIWRRHGFAMYDFDRKHKRDHGCY